MATQTLDQQVLTLIHNTDLAFVRGHCATARADRAALQQLFDTRRDEMSPTIAARAQNCIGCLCMRTRASCWYGPFVQLTARWRC